ncbi:hypothetical protein P389DRAFT_195271 [Cystobasidium minutum MCA 4210]|uniref:uncharacterized protein n=1 Tax=Cystobasidium minutum MCA 4210 TaxID=1397322 RepID=UPI0034CD1EBD|eukprot:jgi/Rhomi1/195271/gm1.3485_g
MTPQHSTDTILTVMSKRLACLLRLEWVLDLYVPVLRAEEPVLGRDVELRYALHVLLVILHARCIYLSLRLFFNHGLGPSMQAFESMFKTILRKLKTILAYTSTFDATASAAAAARTLTSGAISAPVMLVAAIIGLYNSLTFMRRLDCILPQRKFQRRLPSQRVV